MKIHVLFMQRREDFDGEFPPEPILVWDEYSREENPEGFAIDVEEAKSQHAEVAVGFAIETIDVDGAKIRDTCLELGQPLSEVTK